MKGTLLQLGGIALTGFVLGVFEFVGNEVGKQAYDYFKKNFDI